MPLSVDCAPPTSPAARNPWTQGCATTVISFEINPDIFGAFAVAIIGEHVRIYKNPKMTANMPFWMQQDVANRALLRAGRPTPKVRRQVAEVVELEALRQAREERVGKNSRIGT